MLSMQPSAGRAVNLRLLVSTSSTGKGRAVPEPFYLRSSRPACSEETRCRFCHSVLPDWRPALTPQQLKPAASVMSVRYRGVTYRITYTPGPDGLEHFLATLQAIGIKVASASQVTFLCRSPDTGVHCCCSLTAETSSTEVQGGVEASACLGSACRHKFVSC
jgi:hypothetical protein